jgi:hypothetical protein
MEEGMKLQIVMVEKPVRGRGLYHFEFRADGEKIGGAACNPMWQLPVDEQVGVVLEELLRTKGLDIEDFEEFEELGA